ncbi:MAG: glycosyltransferase family 4 protein [Chlorobiaceae bacterium]|nr:glycosyltransferase family 4 protein [Chlorobiaceae bacterium]
MRLLYFLTEDWFFCSHFIDRARAAQQAGYEVAVAAREGRDAEFIRSSGFQYFPTGLQRRSTNPLTELRLLVRVWRIYRAYRPDLVHQAGAKPILYGTIAAKLAGVRHIVNAPIGMGYVFSSTDRAARLFRPLLQLAYRLLVNPAGSRVVFENGDDLETFVVWGAVRRDAARLVRGAGVDLQTCQPRRKGNETPLVVLTARMLEDKGVREFVAAAHLLFDRKVCARFVLVGATDPSNPTAIPESILRAWDGSKGVEWWGWRDDVPEVLNQSDISCLPSYREGLPKSLIEAAACGLPIVTTDTVGCREVVVDGDNGFLVPVRSEEPLADALGRLIMDRALRERMGRNSRLKAEREFDTRKIAAETLALYGELRAGRR